MERLHDIAQVVNEKTQSVRLGISFVTRVKSILNVIVDVRVKISITIFLSEPRYKVYDSYCQIVCFVRQVVIRG